MNWRGGRPWWLVAVIAALAVWFIGSYLPAVSNLWVSINILAPAGQRHLLTFPLAYPAVGVDLHTLLSLIGLLIILCAALRWVTYLERVGSGTTAGAGQVGADLSTRPPSQAPSSGPLPRPIE